jgi:hypothetical protein
MRQCTEQPSACLGLFLPVPRSSLSLASSARLRTLAVAAVCVSVPHVPHTSLASSEVLRLSGD